MPFIKLEDLTEEYLQDLARKRETPEARAFAERLRKLDEKDRNLPKK